MKLVDWESSCDGIYTGALAWLPKLEGPKPEGVTQQPITAVSTRCSTVVFLHRSDREVVPECPASVAAIRRG